VSGVIAGAVIAVVCTMAGLVAGFLVARASAGQLALVPSRRRDEGEPTGVYVESDASQYLRELEQLEQELVEQMSAAGVEPGVIAEVMQRVERNGSYSYGDGDWDL